MSLEVAVAVPFRQARTRRLREGEVAVAQSLDREWLATEPAKRLG